MVIQPKARGRHLKSPGFKFLYSTEMVLPSINTALSLRVGSQKNLDLLGFSHQLKGPFCANPPTSFSFGLSRIFFLFICYPILFFTFLHRPLSLSKVHLLEGHCSSCILQPLSLLSLIFLTTPSFTIMI